MKYLSVGFTVFFIGLYLIGCSRKELNELRAENKELKAEIAELKETAQDYYQQGVYQVSLGKYDNAKDDFQTVIDMFPTSPLVSHAKEQMNKIALVITQNEREQKIDEIKERQKQKQVERMQGTPMDFMTYYTKSELKGLPIGKRYRFEAWLSGNVLRANEGLSGYFIMGKWDIDDDNILRAEEYMKQNVVNEKHMIVVSIDESGHTHIHRIE
jgi:tetratricopeptide (TPR) repeat protein